MTEKIIDTLQIAREKHPGQRNSLDALVQRYEVGGYDREYHGALLDSKILGDVYLAMTGGQSNLLFENKSKSSDTSQLEKRKRKLLMVKIITLYSLNLANQKKKGI